MFIINSNVEKKDITWQELVKLSLTLLGSASNIVSNAFVLCIVFKQ